jgi:hypothetical protein
MRTPHHVLTTQLAPALGGLVVAAGLLVAAATAARAYQAPSGWVYPIACCSGRDCTLIAPTRVRVTAQGYAVSLMPGDHDFITDATGPRGYLVPFATAKPSPDSDFHIYIRPATAEKPFELLCFFAPEPGA